MPTKVTFTKRDIIRAGLEIVAGLGFQGLSARKVAAKLKSSTAPVYSYYGSMNELKKDILEAAKNVLLDYTHNEFTAHAFLNTGVGIIRFAGEQKALFKALFIGTTEAQQIIGDFNYQWEQALVQDRELNPLSPEKAWMIFKRVEIITYGMAALASSEQSQPKDEEQIAADLLEWLNVIVRGYNLTNGR